jgi:hypothetical protein
MQDKEAMQAARDKFIAKETALTDYPKVITMADKALIKGFEAGYLAAKNEWVPINERLPKDGDRVLILYQGGHVDISQNSDTWTHYITHWMPLPSQPNEQNGGKDE